MTANDRVHNLKLARGAQHACMLTPREHPSEKCSTYGFFHPVHCAVVQDCPSQPCQASRFRFEFIPGTALPQSALVLFGCKSPALDYLMLSESAGAYVPSIEITTLHFESA